MRSSGNSKYLKKLNRMTIVNIIRDNELISRQQIAELTGLTPAAITGILPLIQKISLRISHPCPILESLLLIYTIVFNILRLMGIRAWSLYLVN